MVVYSYPFSLNICYLDRKIWIFGPLEVLINNFRSWNEKSNKLKFLKPAVFICIFGLTLCILLYITLNLVYTCVILA